MLQIDGSTGEGGGQVLRSALALSAVSGTPFRIRNVRAGRHHPGLLRQHLTAVQAAAAVTDAALAGAELHSTDVRFHPSAVRPAEYRFAVGSAGSAILVVQTLLPALIRADGCSSIIVEGGTHNPSAPPFEALARSYLPLLGASGARVDAELQRAGFYPRGGGRVELRVTPATMLRPMELDEGGAVRRLSVEAMVAGLPRHIAQREVAAASRHLSVKPEDLRVTVLPETWGPGNVIEVVVERERVTEVFTGFGRKGAPAEQVAMEAVRQAQRYLDSGAAVGDHTADQILLPLALAGSGSFTAPSFSRHAETNAWVIEQFLPVRIEVLSDTRGRCRVEIRS